MIKVEADRAWYTVILDTAHLIHRRSSVHTYMIGVMGGRQIYADHGLERRRIKMIDLSYRLCLSCSVVLVQAFRKWKKVNNNNVTSPDPCAFTPHPPPTLEMSKTPRISKARGGRIDEGLSSLVEEFFPLPLNQNDVDRNPADCDPNQDDRDRFDIERHSSGFELVKRIIEGYLSLQGLSRKC